MNRQQPVPTLEQRRALSAYLEAQREAIHTSERYVPTQKMEMDLPVPSLWQIVKNECSLSWWCLVNEYRENPAVFLFTGLVWLAVLGIGLVLLAVRNGWIQ